MNNIDALGVFGWVGQKNSQDSTSRLWTIQFTSDHAPI